MRQPEILFPLFPSALSGKSLQLSYPQQFFNAAGQHSDLSLVHRLAHDDVSPSSLGRDKPSMHRGDRLLELPADGSLVAASSGKVPIQPTSQPKTLRTMDKYPQVKEAAQARPME